jgi:hypothetical protein
MVAASAPRHGGTMLDAIDTLLDALTGLQPAVRFGLAGLVVVGVVALAAWSLRTARRRSRRLPAARPTR